MRLVATTTSLPFVIPARSLLDSLSTMLCVSNLPHRCKVTEEVNGRYILTMPIGLGVTLHMGWHQGKGENRYRESKTKIKEDWKKEAKERMKGQQGEVVASWSLDETKRVVNQGLAQVTDPQGFLWWAPLNSVLNKIMYKAPRRRKYVKTKDSKNDNQPKNEY